MESMRVYFTQLQAAFLEHDTSKKLTALDGLVRQGNSWVDRLLPEEAEKPQGNRCLMAAGTPHLTGRRGN